MRNSKIKVSKSKNYWIDHTPEPHPSETKIVKSVESTDTIQELTKIRDQNHEISKMYLNLRYLRYIFKIEVQSEVQIEVQDRFYPKVNPENSSVMRMDRN